MEPRYRRILLIALFIATTAAIGFVLYWLFFRAEPVPEGVTPVNAPVAPGGALPAVNQAPFPPGGVPITNVNVPVVNENANAPAVPAAAVNAVPLVAQAAQLTKLPDSRLAYYDRQQGKFYRVRPGQPPEAMSDRAFYEVKQVTWAPTGQRAVLEFPDGSKVSYDFQSQRQVALPREMRDFSFDRGGGKLAFNWVTSDRDKNFLGTANPDGSEVRAVEPIGDKWNDVQVAWSPAQQVIAWFRQGASAAKMEVLFLGQENENFKSVEVDGGGFKGAWSPDGQRMLYSTWEVDGDFRPRLFVVNGSGEQIGSGHAPLGLNTWVDKCGFASATLIYCAVPQSLPRGAGLYPELASGIPDDLYAVDLAKGTVRFATTPQTATGQGLTAQQVVANADGKVYVVAEDGGLYSVSIP